MLTLRIRHVNPTLKRVRIERGEPATRVKRRSQVKNVRCADGRPIERSEAPSRHGTPVDHDFVGIAEEAGRALGVHGHGDGLARPDIEGLRNAVSRWETGIAGGRHLEIALREFVRIFGVFDDTVGVEDGGIGIGDLRDQAVMGAAGSPGLDVVATPRTKFSSSHSA